MNRENQANFIEEDEIDLRELFNTILKYKMFIFIFSTVVTFSTVIYTLSIPNSYSVKTTLLPLEEKGGSSLGGLGALASMAGVSLGGSASLGPADSFNLFLEDKNLMSKFILDNNLTEMLNNNDTSKYRFALGSRFVYDFTHSSEKSSAKEISEDDKLYSAYKRLKSMVSISSDKKTGAMSVDVSDADMYLAKNILELFIVKASSYLKGIDIDLIDKNLDYYANAINDTKDVQISSQLATQISALIQQKIVLRSSPYYKFKMITEPTLPFYQDKTKPKRGLMVVVSAITSLILAIFIIFFREFIKKDDDEVKSI